MKKRIIINDNRKISQYSGNYYRITLPKYWCDLNNVDNNTIMNGSYSEEHLGYILYKINHELEQNSELKIDISQAAQSVEDGLGIIETKKFTKVRTFSPHDQAEDSNFPIDQSTAIFDYLRALWVNGVAQGYNKIVFSYEKGYEEEDSEKLYSYLKRMAGWVRSEDIGCFNLAPEGGKSWSWNIDIEKEKETEYDFKKLTIHLLEENKTYLGSMINVIDKLDFDLWSDASHIESRIDYLWFYATRQVNKLINSGFSSSIESNSLEMLYLTLLYKLIEQSSDAVNKIGLTLLYAKMKIEDEEMWEKFKELESWKSFKENLIDDLSLVCDQCQEIIDLYKTHFEEEQEELSLDKHGKILGIYAGFWKFQVGEMKESYLSELTKARGRKRDRVKIDIGKNLFGNYYNLIMSIQSTCSEKDYGIILSQIFPELRRVAKFPRNATMLAIGLEKSRERNRSPQNTEARF